MNRTDAKEARKIAQIMSKGGIVLYPTDTIWGIGCDATQTEAVKKIHQIKQRDLNKSMLLLADDMSLVRYYTQTIPDAAINITEVSLDPITLIYPKAENLPKEVIANDKSVAFRITNDLFCKEIIKFLGKPIISTSANIAGKPFPKNYKEIDNKIIKQVDYSAEYRREEQVNGKPSAIIKISEFNEITIIRS